MTSTNDPSPAEIREALEVRHGGLIADTERLEVAVEYGPEVKVTLSVLTKLGDERWDFEVVAEPRARALALDLADEALGAWLGGGRPRLTSAPEPRAGGKARLTASYRKPYLEAAADAWLRHGGRPPDDA